MGRIPIRIEVVIMASLLGRMGQVAAQVPNVDAVQKALQQASTFYRTEIASHGGYVYHYSLDLKQRWGEGLATPDQIWVQPPGTPTVGMAYLKAYQATQDSFYLDAARDAAHALAYGQLKSGGWQNCVDFNPRGDRVNLYRNGKGGGGNNSSFDDGQTQSALRFMIQADAAIEFKDPVVHESARVGLQAVLAAQFPNGGFPQVFTGPVTEQRVVQANYPDDDWRTEGRVKNYWDMYTLNDNVTGYLAAAFMEAHQVYGEEQYLTALKKLGDFLILAQMPQPQPGWAQQYNDNMQPIWARKFEPPGISGDETQEVLETLLDIVEYTRDEKYLRPIPSAISWLKKSQLADGQMARYYELKTNRPLYVERQGNEYSLTYSDQNLPDHYGWKTAGRIDEIEQKVKRVKNGKPAPVLSDAELAQRVQDVISHLDQQGRWVSVYRGERLVGQPKFAPRATYLSSERFADHVSLLSEFLLRQKK